MFKVTDLVSLTISCVIESSIKFDTKMYGSWMVEFDTKMYGSWMVEFDTKMYGSWMVREPYHMTNHARIQKVLSEEFQL